MEDTVELIDSDIGPELVIEHLQKSADVSRPWAYIELGLANHDNKLEWLKDWCINSIPKLL